LNVALCSMEMKLRSRLSTSSLKQFAEGLEGAVLIGFALLTPFFHAKRARWGATDDEIWQPLPGDDLVPDSGGGYTHAITIHATTDMVWPWLVQMGQGRGGFYSYELLENMVGCNMDNADQIIPEFQHLKVGDEVTMHPTNSSPYVVDAIQSCRSLILQLRIDTQTGKPFGMNDLLPDQYHNGSWAFILKEVDKATTRLICRSRNKISANCGTRLFYSFIGSVSIIMNRKMLLGIKKRAEAIGKSRD